MTYLYISTLLNGAGLELGQELNFAVEASV